MKQSFFYASLAVVKKAHVLLPRELCHLYIALRHLLLSYQSESIAATNTFGIRNKALFATCN